MRQSIKMDKTYLTWTDVERHITNIAVKLMRDGWKPDYIVGIHSGGDLPAIMLGKMLGIKTYSLDVRLRDGDGDGPETNAWMSEDAFGYPDPADRKKNILVVDDINDTGATIAWIKQDWASSCLPDHEMWEEIWGSNVRVAVMINNLSSGQTVDYFSTEINKAEKDEWIVFPWEEFWCSKT